MSFPLIKVNGNYESNVNTKLVTKTILCGIEHTRFADGIYLQPQSHALAIISEIPVLPLPLRRCQSIADDSLCFCQNEV
jgi:hypothetical protein